MIALNLSNLAVGQCYKNYKELCLSLNEPVKSSDSKTAQINKWSSYFKFKRNGNAYEILEIYDEPIVYKKHQYTSNNPICELMYPIAIIELYNDNLAKNRQYSYPSMIKYRKEFFLLFGFLKEIPNLNNLNNSRFTILRQLQSECYNIFYNTFRSACNSLEKFHCLNCKERYYYNKLPNEDNQESIKHCLADDINSNIIKSNYDLVLSELKCENIFIVMLRGLETEFNEQLNKYLKQYGYSFDSIAFEFSLPYKKESLRIEEKKYDINKYYNELTKGMSKQEINAMVQSCRESINKKIVETIQQKNIEDIKNFKEELRNKFKPATYYKIKADYCDTLTDEQIIEIYSNIRNDFIKKFFIL